jgi:DNA-binding transcriptional ArsR family regulator
MSILGNMMSMASLEDGLAERLERLTGEAAPCCSLKYRELARQVQSSPRFSRVSEQVKALADEKRLLAAALLKRRKELCACEIQAATGLTHATVSHHMGVLTDAGVVIARRRGKWMYYRLNERMEVQLP